MISDSRIFNWALGFVALLLVFACNRKAATENAEATDSTQTEQATDLVLLDDAGYKLAGIQTDTLAWRPLGSGLKVNGMLDVPPEQLISINAPLGGIVEQTSLLQGAHVHKGDVLAIIRNPEFIQLQQEYLQAQGQLHYAKADLERQRELVKEEVAPLKGLQRAEAEFANLTAQIEGLRAKLKLAGLPVGAKPFTPTAKLLAPRDAFVKDILVTVGQSVTPTDALFQLVDPSHLHVELTVFEKDAAQLRKGMPIRFTLPNDSLVERKAHIYLIGRSVDVQQRTVRVHGHLEDEEAPGLLPGMFVKAVVETGRNLVSVLPTKSVLHYEGSAYVFLQLADSAEHHRYRLLPIVEGREEDGYTQVSIPEKVLPAKPRFVTMGAYELLGKLKNVSEEE